MHLVTSSIFLPALCARISPVSQVRLLKAYLVTTLTWAIARGQPTLDIRGFVEEMHKHGSVVGPSASSHRWEDTWMRMVEEARTHHDEHVTKIIRALAGWAGDFGTRKARVPIPFESGDEKSNREDVTEDRTGVGLGACDAVKAPSVGESSEAVLSCRERQGQSDEDSDCSKSGAEKRANELGAVRARDVGQKGDADVSPRAWRGSKNGGDAKDFSQSFYLSGHPQAHFDSNVFPATELEGSEYLDGGLFLRLGVLTLGRMGWDLDGKKKGGKRRWEKQEGQRTEEEFWDFKGFFDQGGKMPEIPKVKL